MTRRGKRTKQASDGAFDRARRWARDGELEKAAAYCEGKTDPDVRRLGALVALRRDRAEDALAFVDGLDDPASLMARAEALIALERHGDARVALEASLRAAPDNPSAYERLAAVSRAEGDLSLALDEAEGALALEPTRTTALGLKASLLQELGRTDEAIETYRAAVRGRGASAGVQASILLAFSALLEAEGAEDEAREARALAASLET